VGFVRGATRDMIPLRPRDVGKDRKKKNNKRGNMYPAMCGVRSCVSADTDRGAPRGRVCLREGTWVRGGKGSTGLS
jgi:hypothetical protein